MLRLTRALALAAALGAAATAAHADAPRRLGYQGRLFKADGTAETGTKKITFRIVDAESGGNELWKEEQTLALSQGAYSTFLGEVTDLPQSLFDGADRFLELVIDGTPLTPRQRIGSVAFALEATNARNVAGGTVDATQVSVGGGVVIDRNGRLAGKAAYKAGAGIALDAATNELSLKGGCASDQVLKWNGTTWDCANDRNSSVAAGPGLKLAGNTLGLVDGCASGQVLKWSGSSWDCADDQNSPVRVATGSGLSVTNNTLSLTKGCTAGESLRFDGTGWVCAPVNDYAAGAGIRISGSTIATNLAGAGTINQASNPVDWTQLKNVPASVANGAPTYSAGSGVEIAGSSISLPTTCSSGQVLKFDGAGWKCASDANSAYVAGNGIEIGNNTLSLTKECANGQILRWNGAQWGCDNINAYQAGAGLTLTNNTFALPGCVAGQVLKATANGWSCQADADTGSSYAAGDGLVLDATNKFNVDFETGQNAGTSTKAMRADRTFDDRYYTKAQADSAQVAQGGFSSYTAVITINNAGVDCPAGWTLQPYSQLLDTSNYVYVHINKSGLIMGGSTDGQYESGGDNIAQRIHNSHGIVKLCHRTYRTRGKPHVAMYTLGQAGPTPALCPADYTFVRNADVMRNDNYTWFISSDAGFFLGASNANGWGANEYQNGAQGRQTTSTQTTAYCFKVMGVEEDPDSKFGVYPVSLGVRAQAACPADWTYMPHARLRRTDSDYMFLTYNDNSSVLGGSHQDNTWSNYAYANGSNWNYLGVGSGNIAGVCTKYFHAVERPRVNIRTLKQVACAANEMAISAAQLNSTGSSTTVHLQRTGSALWIGNINTWGVKDVLDGYNRLWFTPGNVDNVCLRVEGVSNF